MRELINELRTWNKNWELYDKFHIPPRPVDVEQLITDLKTKYKVIKL